MVLSMISFVYIIAAIVTLSIVIWFYTKHMDEGQKLSVKKMLATYGPYLVLIGLYLYFRNRWGLVSESSWPGEMKLATFYFWFILLLWNLANLFLARERYVSTHAVADNRSGSCAKYREQGEYIIINIGSCDAAAFPWPFGTETWVVPREHFKKVNGILNSPTQIYVTANIDLCELDEIPSDCKDFIQTNKEGYDKENIFYGEFSQGELDQFIEIDTDKGKRKITKRDFNLKIKDTQRMLNEQRTMTKGKYGDLKRFWSDHASISRKMSGKSLFDNMQPGSAGADSGG